MVLINGAEGIGTGWSTNIPNYNPKEIAENIKKLINGDDDLIPMHPWYRGFKVTIFLPLSVTRYSKIHIFSFQFFCLICNGKFVF